MPQEGKQMKKSLLALPLLLCALHVNAGNMSTEIIFGEVKYDHDGKIKNPSDVESLSSVDYASEDLEDRSLGIRQIFRMSDNWDFEIGYHTFGESSAEGLATMSAGGAYWYEGSTDITALSLGIKGGKTFHSGVGLYGRVGITRWDLDVDQLIIVGGGSAFKFSASDSDFDLYAGIDLRYSVTNNMSIGLQYTVYDMNSDFILSGLIRKEDITIEETAIAMTFHY